MRVFLLRSAIAQAVELQKGDKIPDGFRPGDYLVQLPQNDGPIPMSRSEFARHYVGADELQPAAAQDPPNLEREGGTGGAQGNASSSSSSTPAPESAAASSSASSSDAHPGIATLERFQRELEAARRENDELRRQRDAHARTHEPNGGASSQGDGQAPT